MTNLSNASSQDTAAAATTTIEGLTELTEVISASSTCADLASSPPTRSTYSSSSNRPNVDLRPGDMYEAPLNDEIADSSEYQQQAEGNKRRRESRRRRRCSSALSVECHPFFNGQYLAYLEDEVHKKQQTNDADQQGADKNQENSITQATMMCPPTLIAEKTFDNAHACSANGRRRVRRAKRRTSRSEAATSA